MRKIFSFFYDENYLRGYYFDEKIMGWYWAFINLPGRLFGINRSVPWPVHARSIVSGYKNIVFDNSSICVFHVPGCYWQAIDAEIKIGKECYVAPNVGIITTNHDIYNLQRHVDGKAVEISDFCWIGMNSMILPGVKLGKHTIVAAGAVVTKSFPDGYCVIGGNPAKIIKQLNPIDFDK